MWDHTDVAKLVNPGGDPGRPYLNVEPVGGTFTLDGFASAQGQALKIATVLPDPAEVAASVLPAVLYLLLDDD